MDNEWFSEWFDTPYYHLLYKNRDDKEAELFIDALLKKLQLAGDAKIIDVACGKGRHSIYFNKLGFDVTGIDLSENSIKTAQAHENTKLAFFKHDMRLPFRINYYNAAFNLFTSIGYFDKESDNVKAIRSMYLGLKPKGQLIIDFFNTQKVQKDLKCNFNKIEAGIDFKINKEIKNGFIYKQISFTDKGKNYCFQERVQALTLSHFKSYFDAVGFKILALYGNYKLESFDENTSERLIIVAEKSTKY